MTRVDGLLFGPLGAVILAAAIVSLPVMVPGYDPVFQTVSEIGRLGSPAQPPFKAILCAMMACFLVVACARRETAVEIRSPTLPAYLIGYVAVSGFGIGLFPFPWASKRQPINCKRCCTDPLNQHSKFLFPGVRQQRRKGL